MTAKRTATRGCVILLLVVILWRVLGSPVALTEWRALETPFWQARTLLPSRISRALLCWTVIAPKTEAPDTALMSLPMGASRDETVSVFLTGEGVIDMPLEQYVLGVVAAEMPASYHIEALKAQAVAARTRAVCQMLGVGCIRTDGADICGDSAHCQGFLTLKECSELWREGAEGYMARVTQAVTDTSGVVITYDGQPITVLYHAISGGRTEDAQTVFSQALPYLISVESRGEEGARGFITEATLSRTEAAQRLTERFPESGVTAENISERLRINKYAESGRVDTLLLGNSEIRASELRSALGLRSTWFDMRFTDEAVVFEQRGYGHGVGMSQAGANAMAAAGGDYRDILSHYYQDTKLMDAASLINR